MVGIAYRSTPSLTPLSSLAHSFISRKSKQGIVSKMKVELLNQNQQHDSELVWKLHRPSLLHLSGIQFILLRAFNNALSA